jgi:ribonuclease R
MLMTNYRKKDPFKKREQEKYENPVASREHILAYLKESDRPVSYSHLVTELGVKGEEQLEGLRRRLKAMIRDGQIMTNRRGSYGIVTELNLIPGRVEGHKDGFGYLIPDTEHEDVYIPARQMRLIFPGDRVLVRVTTGDFKRRRPEGIIVEVIERNTTRVTGRFFKEDGLAFVEPDVKQITQAILIPLEETKNAKEGQYVVTEITAQPTLKRQPVGRVIEIIGDRLTPGLEIELAIRSYNLPYEWDEASLAEAHQYPDHVRESDFAGRKDLRQLPFVTIDGEDAKDFDDAVYVHPADDGYQLYVAIADVTYYLKPNSPLDISAKERGNSVYFPQRVVPMLPEALSNELCSLKPKQDRLVMVCEMKLKQDGSVKSYEFYESVIHSHARLTYNQVAAVLEGGDFDYPELVPHLKAFHELYEKLILIRKERGAIDFETIDTRVIFDDKGKIEKIIPVKRNVAHKMIEEAMLLANVCAADQLQKKNIPTLYRVHDVPDAQKIESLKDFLKAFGLRIEGAEIPTAKDYSKLIERIQGRPDVHILQTVMLRSLRQAVYSPNNAGHFGLAYEAYLHFTSPIRRYPDVLVHRALKYVIKKEPLKAFEYDPSAMQHLGEHCSMTERRADEATREALNWLKCEYMLEKVGKEFTGTISGVTGFGLFVELDDIYIEGLVHITNLSNDYYTHDATHHHLTGKTGGKVYRLGDRIKVLVARVDLDNRQIDFEPA